MAQIIENCIITHKNSEVAKSYDVKAGSEIYHTGIDIKAKDVFCPCNGVCIFTGLIEEKPSCTVQYSPNICLRFTNLKEVCVAQGQVIEPDTKVGVADKFVHFEYLTSEQNFPNFRVFFNATVSYYMYKHDPMLVLSGNTVFQNRHIAKDYSYTELKSMYDDFSKIYETFTGKDAGLLAMRDVAHSDLFDDLKGE